MRITIAAGIWACAGALAMAGGSVAAAAQQKQLSEQAVKKYMEYAWTLTPQKFTKPDGKTVEIDKKQKDKALVPVDTGREVIMAARMTAYAQVCELAQDQVDNYRSLMRREEAKSKWTDQQLIFINQLHLTTVMLLTGKIKLVERDGDKEVVIDEKEARTKKPSDEECKKVREAIVAYVKSGPPLTAAEAQSPAPPITGATPAAKKQ